MKGGDGPFTAGVNPAVDILRELKRYGPLTAAELAALGPWALGTVYGCLRSLKAHGLVVQPRASVYALPEVTGKQGENGTSDS